MLSEFLVFTLCLYGTNARVVQWHDTIQQDEGGCDKTVRQWSGGMFASLILYLKL